jgi:hypothetical protein
MVKQHLKAAELQGLQDTCNAGSTAAAAAAAASPGTAASTGQQPQLAVVASRAAGQHASAVPAAEAGAAGAKQQLQRLVQQIQANASKCGEGHWVVAGAGVNEECERELEQEEEQEEEQEVQVPCVDAAAEQDWHYAAVFAANSAKELSAVTGVCRLPEVMPLLQPSCVCNIPWSSKLFVTTNFFLTTACLTAGGVASAAGAGSSSATAAVVAAAARAGPCLSQYLRPVDSMLLFANGDVLLLSEREAEGVLEQLYRDKPSRGRVSSSSSSSRPVLLSLSYARLARSAADADATSTAAAAQAGMSFLLQPLQPLSHTTAATGSSTSPAPCAIITGKMPQVPELVSAHLFNGGSMFDGDQQQLQVLQGMVQRRREAAETLLDSRGTQSQLPRSELELACDEHAAVAKCSRSAVLVSASKRCKG